MEIVIFLDDQFKNMIYFILFLSTCYSARHSKSILQLHITLKHFFKNNVAGKSSTLFANLCFWGSTKDFLIYNQLDKPKTVNLDVMMTIQFHVIQTKVQPELSK